MKKIIASLVLVASFGQVQSAAVSVNAQQMVTVVDIVVVNVMEVFQALIEVQDLMKDLQNFLMKKAEMLQKMDSEGKEREKNFAMKAKNLTVDARDKEHMELERLKNEIRIQAENLDAKQKEEQMLIQQKVAEKIKDFCQKMGWKIVLPGAIYVDPSLDKTKIVIDGMNKEYAAKKAAKKTVKN